MSDLLTNTAEVLEKLATYLDVVEDERQTIALEARRKTASEIRDKLTNLTGGAVDDAVVDKLATSDDAVVELFNKLAVNLQEADSMGGPGSGSSYSGESLTTVEQAKQADDRFLAWLQS